MKVAEADSDLLRLSATEMAAKIRRREITSTELIEAHIARIEQTHADLNAVVVPLFDEARQTAKAADKALAADDVTKSKPLLGVPITIKEFFDVQGTKTTAGIAARNTPLAQTDAVTVARLRAAGAIVLGKTNVPQLGLAIESENPVYGRTRHPQDLDRSPGGSSGGESSIISAFGSPLGLGSDGGGSIRIPSHFCGLCGLKPTAHRLSMKGHWQLPSFPGGWAVPGPMARDVEDLELAMQCLMRPSETAKDPYQPTTSLGTMSKVDVSELRIGYYDDDQFVRPSPAIRRAVKAATHQLESLGATLVPFEPAPMLEAWKVNLGLFYADGGKWMRKMLGDSPIDARVKKTLLTAALPTAVRRAIPGFLESMGQKTMATLVRLSRQKQLSAFGYQKMYFEQLEFRREFLERWNACQLDALICPPFPSVAMTHMSPDILLGYGYTFLFNLLGMPAGVVPVTHVQKNEESDRKREKDNLIGDLIRAEEGSAGLPVGVQVVGQHWREDVVLAIMSQLRNVD